MNKILVTGINGMLGSVLFETLRLKGFDVYGTKREDLDIVNVNKTLEYIDNLKPDVIINCVAYTNVNDAEDVGKDDNFAVNHLGTKNLLEASNKVGAIFFQISTDYVFGENSEVGYVESSKADSSLNQYGLAKRQGELETEKNKNKYFVCRTSWLYGPNGKNFVKTMLDLAKTREELSVVIDEVGTPTFTVDLVEQLIYMLNNLKSLESGYYHLVNSGKCSRFEQAEKAIRTFGLSTKLNKTTLASFPRKAKVPNVSILLNTKLPQMRNWDLAIEDFVKNYYL